MLESGDAVELARRLENREEFLAHMLIDGGLLEDQRLANAVGIAARAAYQAPPALPPMPVTEVNTLDPLLARALHGATISILKGDTANHEALRRYVDADARIRDSDEPFPFPPDIPDAPPVTAETPAPTALWSGIGSLGRRLEKLWSGK